MYILVLSKEREKFYLQYVGQIWDAEGGAQKMQLAHVSGLQLQPYAAIPAIGFPRVEG